MQALTQNADSNMSQFRTQGQTNDSETTTTARERILARVSSGWSDLEALANIADSNNALHDVPRVESSRSRRAIPVITDVWTGDTLFSRIRVGSREHQQNPDDTAGLTWSEDGQIL